ncbi:MAG TPA: DUF2752 domain-containing protein [Acidimicrobiales bacterium]
MGLASPTHAHGAGAHARDRLRPRLAVLAALGAATAYVGAVDPEGGGLYPVCPSRALLGVDCPACGGLRGTHDLLHGDMAGALDHNLLLPAALAVAAVALALWLLPLVGRPARTLRPPRWLVVAATVVVVAFTVLRNLPVAGLDVLASGAG